MGRCSRVPPVTTPLGAEMGKGVVTGGKSGIQASRGKGSAKSFPRAVFVPACYGAPRSQCWRPCQHLGPTGRHPAERRTTCRRAVIALHGRTPRQGTAGHVATRRGLDRIMRPGGRRADLSEAAGSRAVARCWSRSGPRRDATRRRLGPNTPAMPGAVPATVEGASRRNRARGRCRTRHAAAAASDGSAKSVEGITQRDCESAVSRKGRRIAHHNSATPRPPRVAGRGRSLSRVGGGPRKSAADARRATRRPPPPAVRQRMETVKGNRRLHVSGN